MPTFIQFLLKERRSYHARHKVSNNITTLHSSHAFIIYIFFRISTIFIFFVLLAVSRADSFEEFGETVENAAYQELAKSIVMSGKSKDYAKCFVYFLRLQQPIGDYKAILSDPKNFIESVDDKANIAATICQHGTAGVIVALVLTSLVFVTFCIFCYCCLKCLLCSSSPRRSVDFVESRYRNPNQRSKFNKRASEKVEMCQSPPPNYV